MSSPTRRPAARPRPVRLCAVPLEDRTAPATFTVTNLNDAGTGSLRDAITQLNASGDATNTINAHGVTGTIALVSALPTITKSVTVTGPGAASLTVSGGNAFSVFTVNTPGGGATIDRMTIAAGKSATGGAAVRFQNVQNASLVSCKLTNNTATVGDGGAVLVSSATSVTLDGCEFSGNTASGAGARGGAVFTGSGTLALYNCTLSKNTASSGGGLAAAASGSVYFLTCSFSENTASTAGGDGNGGAVYADGISGSLSVNVCTFSANKAPGGDGGGLAAFGLSATLSSCTITGNSARGPIPGVTYGGGGGLFAKNSTVTLTGCTVGTQAAPNTTDFDGGGIYTSGGSLTLYSSTVGYNTAQFSGGGVMNRDGAVTFNGGQVNNNTGGTGTSVGGGVGVRVGSASFSDCTISMNTLSVGYGGGVSATNSALSMTRCTVTGNQVGGSPIGFGGGVYFNGFNSGGPLLTVTLSSCTFSKNDALTIGGGIFAQFGNAAISNSTFDGNTALRGAGIAVTDVTETTVTGCTVMNNKAADYGGGLFGLANTAYGSQKVTLQNCHVSSNKALLGPGGGICLINQRGPVSITKSTIDGNTAEGDGGGVFLSQPVGADTITLTIQDTTVSANLVPQGNSGGGLFVAGLINKSTLLFTGSTFNGNTAGHGAGVTLKAFDCNAEFRNCTISGNVADNQANDASGGGILWESPLMGRNLKLSNCTVYDNTADKHGGGIMLVKVGNTQLDLDSTIVAGNHLKAGAGGIDVFNDQKVAPVITVNANASFIGIGNDGNVSSFSGTGNQVGSTTVPFDPRLLSLSNNGGPTKTHAPVFNSFSDFSPVIDKGRNAVPLTFDQRGPGFPREVNTLFFTATPTADVGAYEIQQLPVVTYAENAAGAAANTHSRINKIELTFPGTVTLTGSPITLKHLGQSQFVTLAVSVSGSVVTLKTYDAQFNATDANFTESTDKYHSLIDGNYQIVVQASGVKVNGVTFDGNGDGVPGGDFLTVPTGEGAIYRLFGDAVGTTKAGFGDRYVGALDYQQFLQAYTKSGAVFDFDGDGTVTMADYTQFQARYGSNLLPP